MKLAGSIAELVENSIKSKNAAPLFFLASSLNGILVEGHCSAKYEWVDCAADVLEILGLFIEKMNLGARLEGANSLMSSYVDAYIVGRDYAKETNKSVGIAILDVDAAWQDQINIIRKNSLLNQIAVSGVENLFEAYNASESCATNEFRSHGVCVSNQKNCGSLSAPIIPVQLAPPYVANPGLTYGFSTTPSPKVGYPYASYLWKTSELSTPLIGASAQQNFVFNTVGSATVSVTPILTDGTVCTSSAVTTQITVESALVRTVAAVLPSSAAIGVATTFTITGQNLPLTPTMTLGGIPCQIQSSPAPTASGFTAVCTPGGVAGNQGVIIKSAAGGEVIDASRMISVSSAPQGWVVSTLARLVNPVFGISVDSSGNVYGAEVHQHNIAKISSMGSYGRLFDGHTAYVNCGYLLNPYGVSVGSNGVVYVANTGYNIIDKITGNIKTTIAGNCRFGLRSDTILDFYGPVAIAVGADGTVYVANAGYSDLSGLNVVGGVNVQKIAPDGTAKFLAGSGVPGWSDGQGAAASFDFRGVAGLAVDLNGNVYVADAGNHRIRKISSTGYVTTVAGSGIAGASDGQGTSATFNFPLGVAIDSKGNLFIADNGNNLVRMISPSGMVSTVAGGGPIVGGDTVDGSGSAVSFSNIMGIAIDKNDNTYLSEVPSMGYYSKIRKMVLAPK